MATEESPTAPPRRWLIWWRRAVGIGLLSTLILVIGPRELIATCTRVAPGWALATAAVACLWFLLGGLKVWLLLRCLAPLRFAVFLPAYLTSWATAQLLPGQLGDATQILLLRQEGIPMRASGAAYLADKVLSFAWMLLVAAYGVGLYTPHLRPWWLLVLPLGGLLAGAGAVAVLRRIRSAPGRLLARLRDLVDRLLEQLWTYRHYRATMAVNLTLTVVKWLLMALVYLGTFHAFGAALEFEAVATVPVMSSLVGYIPVTVGGAGTMEWTAVMLFGRMGVAAATVFSVFLFIRVMLLLIALFSILAFRPKPSR